jgi:D-sedoheptulose 7-phosphate isomerase
LALSKKTKRRTAEDYSVSNYIARYLDEVGEIAARIDQKQVQAIVDVLVETRSNNGRLFILGVGGGAGNATHAVNDFRKIANIESYTPTDNASELTARVNDDGWDSCFSRWLEGSRLRKGDSLMVFSVGGGNLEKNISANIVKALEYAKKVGAKITGIVGRDGGYTAKVGDAVVVVPTISQDTVTPHAESFQAVVWHMVVSHPQLQANAMKWESTDSPR